MSSLTPIEKAREAVNDLLHIMGIERVVCVDNIYAQERAVEDILPVISRLSTDELARISPELNEEISGELPEEIRNEKFRRAWDEFNSEKQKTLAKQILAAASIENPEDEDDSGFASILEELIDEEKLSTLSFQEWKLKKDDILKSSEETTTLILFDQDLSEDGGMKTEGMAIISNIMASAAAETIFCGLLTHTVTIDNQHQAWEDQAKQHTVDKDRFVLISKSWLSQDPVGFARMLKLVALSPNCKLLKDKMADLLHRATDVAKKRVGEITVFDFDHIVCRAAQAEGIWEPDMLFRLFGIFHRTEAMKEACSTREIEKIAYHLRSVSHIPTDSESSPVLTTWKIQQEEMYDSSEYINKLHLPIDIGDIFKKINSESSKSYILLSQPCNLMIRSSGKREPETKEVILAEIVQDLETKTDMDIELPYFGEDPKQCHYVRLGRVHSVKLCVLDLCVYDKMGRAVFDLGATCPKGLIPAWSKRFERSKRDMKRIVIRYNLLRECKTDPPDKKQLKRKYELINGIVSTLSSEGLFKATFSQTGGSERIEFNCQRMRRLSRPRATALLAQYAACISRPAFERDLGKEIKTVS